jgi:nicotinamidase-related amidase
MIPSPNLLTPNNHALVLIDFQGQLVFATNGLSLGEFRNNTAIVAGTSKIFGVPTIITTVVEKAFAGPVFPEIEGFYPQATSDYIDRTSLNTWEDATAYKAIVEKGKQKLVLAGLWTSVCIVGPALSALAEGFQVYFIADACGDVSPEAHERAVQRMIQAGATPMTAIQYLLELQRDWARHETYIAVTDLAIKYSGGYGIGIHYAQHILKH